MKFPQLAIGQHFEFQGETYIKVGPLTAQSADGKKSRMIPRSALVTPLDGTPAAPPTAASAPLEAEAMLQALATCQQACRELLGGNATSSAELEQAFDRCRRELGLSS